MFLKWILQFLIGIAVGIYGYLSPSIINIQIFHLATRQRAVTLWRVIAIVAIIEIPYCFICMSGMQWLMSQELLMNIIKWLIVIFLLAMAWFLYAQQKKKETPDNKSNKSLSVNQLLIYAIFNPFQLSAWTIWGAYFIEKEWFDWSWPSILLFSVGASIGVFIILRLYAIAGNSLIRYFQNHKQRIDMGVIYLLLILALVQLVKNLTT